jgi:hypothetical protein
VALSIFSASDSKKISLKLFELEMRKFFKMFLIIMDQKSQNQVAILKSVFRLFRTNIEEKL